MFYANLFFAVFVFSFGKVLTDNVCPVCKDQQDVPCFKADVKWYSGNVVSAFNQRVITAAHIGKWKKKRGKPIFDPTRVKFLLEAIAQWNEGPLENSTVKDFFSLVINRTTEYEYKDDNIDNPPPFHCSFFYKCKRGVETSCKESCSQDDPDLNCWRDNINVYTKSLLVSINQLAILEAHLAKSLVDNRLPPISAADVRRRIADAVEANQGKTLPDEFVEDIFEKIFNFTLKFAETTTTTTKTTVPKFDCEVSPICKSNADKKDATNMTLQVLLIIVAFVIFQTDHDY